MIEKEAVLEGLLFVVGDEGITLGQIQNILDCEEEEAKNLIIELRKKYEDPKRGIRITFLGNAFKLTTKKEHKEFYQKLAESPKNHGLSQAALEILAIIAYNEPVTVQAIEEMRGVGSRDMIRKLVAKDLVKELGKSDMPGRPNLYGITSGFLDYFGLASKDELPSFEEMKVTENDDVDLYNSRYKEDKE